MPAVSTQPEHPLSTATSEEAQPSTPNTRWDDVQLPASYQSIKAKEQGRSNTLPTLAVKSKGQRIFDFFMRAGIILAGLLAGLLIFLYALKFILPESMRPAVDDITLGVLPGAEPNYPLLLLGVDSNQNASSDAYEGARSDTILLVRPMPGEQTLNVVSLPRDSKVYTNEALTRIDKLNAAFSLGGGERTRDVINLSLGLNVEKYIAVDYKAIRAMVDALGGVNVFVEKRMSYHDNAGRLHIELTPGWNHMEGRTAEGYLRFRHDAYGDIGRVRRQQAFLAALRNRLNSTDVVMRLPELIQIMNTYVRTNLNTGELLQLASYMKKIPPKDMRFATLPGHTSDSERASYWIIDKEEATQLLSRLIYGVNASIAALPGQVLAPVNQIGIVYHKNLSTEGLQELEQSLEALGWVVTCRRSGAVGSTLINDRTMRLSTEAIRNLQTASSLLTQARVNFTSPTSSLGANACGSEQVSLYVGGDVVEKETASSSN
jgi:LCP family protein required for cell wall assembly